jgi:hypothetical protein
MIRAVPRTWKITMIRPGTKLVYLFLIRLHSTYRIRSEIQKEIVWDITISAIEDDAILKAL